MPIIELKLTGPASEQQAMEKLLLDVKRVAGQRGIFEGPEGLPATESPELQRPPVTPAPCRPNHRAFDVG
ncbi:inactive PncC family protein [Escherichia coli]|nr:inactive PncC family protein [Escherichia coli]